MKIKRKKIKLIFVLLAFLFIALIGKLAGQFLVVNEQPQKADVIAILAGDRGYRTERGAELFHAGYAPYIIVSGGPIYNNITAADLMMNHAMELGIPAEAIIKESHADSTYQNAFYTKEIMEQRGFKSVIIVSSEFHMRRVKLVFERVFKDTDIKLIYCAAKDPAFDPDHWWSSNKSIMNTFNEYVKLMGYFFNRDN